MAKEQTKEGKRLSMRAHAGRALDEANAALDDARELASQDAIAALSRAVEALRMVVLPGLVAT